MLLPHNFSCKMFKCKCSLYCYCAWMRVCVCVCLCECCWFKYFSQNLAPVAMLTGISTKWSILFSLDRSHRRHIQLQFMILFFLLKIFHVYLCLYFVFQCMRTTKTIYANSKWIQCLLFYIGKIWIRIERQWWWCIAYD